MARKQESTSEKIVRMYKEGYYVEEIAKALEMPKDNVPKILETHMPDYETFVQPERTHEDPNAEKTKIGLSTPVSALFKRKSKKIETEPEPSKVTINLAMNENGFVDRAAAGIASMLQKGNKSANEIAEFFSKDIADIKAVEENMAEHFARIEKSAEPEPASEPAVEEKPDNKFTYSNRSTQFTSGLEEAPAVKPVVSKRDEPKPVSQSYGLAPDTTPVEQEQEYHEPVYVEPVSYVEPDFSKPEMEEIPEMPSIDPVSLDVLDKELEKAPAPVADIPAIGEDDTNTEAAINTMEKEEDAGMSPMEKMKKFAEEQIALNNQKIEELQNNKTDAENAAFDSNTKVTNVQKQIEELELELVALTEEKTKAAAVVSAINDEIESIKKENAEFKNYIG